MNSFCWYSLGEIMNKQAKSGIIHLQNIVIWTDKLVQDRSTGQTVIVSESQSCCTGQINLYWTDILDRQNCCNGQRCFIEQTVML